MKMSNFETAFPRAHLDAIFTPRSLCPSVRSTNDTAVRAYAAELLSAPSGPTALALARVQLPSFNVNATSIRSVEVNSAVVVATRLSVGANATLQAWLLDVSLQATLVGWPQMVPTNAAVTLCSECQACLLCKHVWCVSLAPRMLSARRATAAPSRCPPASLPPSQPVCQAPQLTIADGCSATPAFTALPPQLLLCSKPRAVTHSCALNAQPSSFRVWCKP